MVGGKNNRTGDERSLDVEGGGQSAGLPATRDLDSRHVYSPTGIPGARHWEEGYITRPGLDDRSSVFFAAVEMTRMPMLVTDPNQPDNPIVFSNLAFLELTQYDESEVLGRNCRFLQGPQTDPEAVDEIRTALTEQRAVAVDILNYRRDGTLFWNALSSVRSSIRTESCFISSRPRWT